MQRPHVDHATPTLQRAVTSYPARHLYKPGVVVPPSVPHVVDTIDLHCHCSPGQQDALALAQLASESGMFAIVFKTIRRGSGPYAPGKAVNALREDLERWAESRKVRPIVCVAGYVVGLGSTAPSVDGVRDALDDGARAVWLPVSTHANSYLHVGARESIVVPGGDPHVHTGPLPWAEALRCGHYMLDDRGALVPVYAEIIRLVADRGATLFFGHATHAEIDQIVQLLDRLGYRRAVIDHPFSPFVDLDVPLMRELSRYGVTFNFTYDELSPLLGVDPHEMWAAIGTVGVEHCSLSSDAGEPLLPNSVECMRLIRAYMEAFGATYDDLDRLCTINPARVLDLTVERTRVLPDTVELGR